MTIKYDNSTGLVPAIIQDSSTRNVLMLGYMNEAAYQKTISTKKVTFYSRSKQRLWTKGETSDNSLNLVNIKLDCDNDTLLVLVKPDGPTCHLKTDTCWGDENISAYSWINHLEDIIENRYLERTTHSYVSDLFNKGMNKIAQKVGEEAIEMVIEAKDNNDKLFLDESADLLFHYLILLKAKGFKMNDVLSILEGREKKDA